MSKIFHLGPSFYFMQSRKKSQNQNSETRFPQGQCKEHLPKMLLLGCDYLARYSCSTNKS